MENKELSPKEEIIMILKKYYYDFNERLPDGQILAVWERKQVCRLWNLLLKMEEEEIIKRYQDIINSIQNQKWRARLKQILRGLFDANIYISHEEAESFKSIIGDVKKLVEKYSIYNGAVINIIE